MRQRLFALTSYFLRTTILSLPGIIYLILALLFWLLFFNPSQGTPDIDNYIVLIAAAGCALSFLITFSITSRANQVEHAPLIVRLPSRVEYLTAVFLSIFFYATALQLLIALLALIRGPGLIWTHFLEIPPIWLSLNILFAVLALHASDLVSNGWSRVYVYGILAVLLFGQNANSNSNQWLVDRASALSRFFFQQNLASLGNWFNSLSGWLNSDGISGVGQWFGYLFWPFRALVTAVRQGSFTVGQALTPAVLLLYATILFLLAAHFFATKDLDFME